MPEPEEMFDVVDEHDMVLGQVKRSEVHARKLLHRAVHVFVFNSRGEMLLQKRTATKDEYPGCYTSSASGHVSAGETYAESAPRELLEELGIRSELTWLAKMAGNETNAYEHAVLYQTTTDAPVIPDPEEIASVRFWSLDEIDMLLKQSARLFTPPFRQFYAWYRNEAVTGKVVDKNKTPLHPDAG